MLKLNSINKKFKSIVVADNINVQLENCTYGLLGRNGSGKTTLLRCITKIEKLNGGSITYSDCVKETNDYLTHIGYLPQNFEIFNELTPYEVLQFFANLKDYGITDDEINNLLKSLNLFSKKDTVVKKLSGGMKQGVAIARACSARIVSDSRYSCAVAVRVNSTVSLKFCLTQASISSSVTWKNSRRRLTRFTRREAKALCKAFSSVTASSEKMKA